MTYSREMGPLVPGVCWECQAPTGDEGTLCYTCRRVAIEAELREYQAAERIAYEVALDDARLLPSDFE